MAEQNQSLIKLSGGLLGAMAQPGGLGISVFAQEILVLKCIVAGTSFRNFSEETEKFVLAENMLLKREPKNEHDEFAVAVYQHEVKAGYLPRDKNEVIARLLDGGKNLYARLTEKEWEGNWLRLEIDVFLKD